MDSARANFAWSSFREVATNYTLEGEPMPWLCCALFLACRPAVEEDQQNADDQEDGNTRAVMIVCACDADVIWKLSFGE